MKQTTLTTRSKTEISVNKSRGILLIGIVLGIFLVFAGCSEDSSTGPTGSGNPVGGSDNTSMSVKVDNGVSDASSVSITEAKALITEVELETEPSGSSQHIRIAPFVIYFNTGGALVTVTTGNLPSGTFNKIKFKIHKPEDTEPIPDPEFREGTSGNQRYSFIIKGTYNGSSFVYKSRKSASLVINLPTPISTGSNSRNITVLVNPSLWFTSGGSFLDPRNSVNENQIDDNLKNSFKRAFKDDNKDGSPDDN